MTVSTGSVTIKKDASNLIGISIGGGSPLCPCLYIVQVFDGTPASLEGSLQSGDELLGINGTSVKGKTKVEVAKMIQSATDEVIIHYNKLHADSSQGVTLDILMKKIKHRVVESMSSSTADSLGLSRAILCNDSLVKRLEELEGTELMYKGLVDHAKRMLKAYYDLLQTFKAFGDAFADISVREPQPRASEAFRLFSELHRNLDKDGVNMFKAVKPVLADLGTYLTKAIPDTKMTVKKYADAKFSYLSYCLKVKEMDDEEHSFAAIQEPLYRVETGNYEYRLVLRCRQEARTKFAKLRNDVLEKMELLENKHSMDLSKQLKDLLNGLALMTKSTQERLHEIPNLFPIEVDLKDGAFQYKNKNDFSTHDDDEDEAENHPHGSSDVFCGMEAVEKPAVIEIQSTTANLFDQFTEIDLNDAFSTSDMKSGKSVLLKAEESSSEMLLMELGLTEIELSVNSGESLIGDFLN